MKKSIFIVVLAIIYFSCRKESVIVEQAQDAVAGRASGGSVTDYLYVQTNDFHENANEILIYRHINGGKLQQFGGAVSTRGSGVGNPSQVMGPMNSDNELKATPDNKFLLAVNSGSNTIAVFSIKSNGGLEHVTGSPFPSGGQTPVSIDIAGNYVFVANKSQNPMQAIWMAPNYSTFTIDGQGKLTPVAGARYETRPGASPAQNLVSLNHKFLFTTDFMNGLLSPAGGTLYSFAISNTGMLTPVVGAPYVVPSGSSGINGALGLWQHPSGNVLYASLPFSGQVGVYRVDGVTGSLQFEKSVSSGSGAAMIRTNDAGTRMYVMNSYENTVSVFNIDNPLSPVMIHTLGLKNPGPTYNISGVFYKASEPYSMAISSDERTLYLINQHTHRDYSIGNYNLLHYLTIAPNGVISEPVDPLSMPVANTIRPKGSVVVNR